MPSVMTPALIFAAIAMLGSGTGRAESLAEWQRDLAEHIRCHLIYPNGLGRPTSPRTALVVFEIGADSSLGNVNIERRSGVMVFDRIARAAVADSSPAPPPPPDLQRARPLTVSIPLTCHPPRNAAGGMSEPQSPRPDSPKNEPPVCRDVGII